MPTSSTSDRWTLSWRSVPPPNNPLPDNITRSFVDSPWGPLELLSAKPNSEGPGTYFVNPILFIHGGFGCAEVWLPFLACFSALGYSCHALSIRGHGHSWHPGYLRMTFFTTASMLAGDVAFGMNHLETIYGQDVILVAHSNGCGLAQLVCDQELARVKGLALFAGVPSYGGLGVYASWWKLDPWFMIRMLRDWYHPRSPLSSTSLVHAAFFSPKFPDSQVKLFEQLLSPTESFLWPLSMMWRFVDNERVLSGCGLRLLLLAAEKDKLMTLPIMQRNAAEYAASLQEMKKDSFVLEETRNIGIEGRVTFKIVQGSGHHVMNDLQWVEAAQIFEDWLEDFQDSASQ